WRGGLDPVIRRRPQDHTAIPGRSPVSSEMAPDKLLWNEWIPAFAGMTRKKRRAFARRFHLAR
ncbi:MAG TPA: hypothetical protein VGK80_12865, partial [Rhodanobacteraceae bacterium]